VNKEQRNRHRQTGRQAGRQAALGRQTLMLHTITMTYMMGFWRFFSRYVTKKISN